MPETHRRLGIRERKLPSRIAVALLVTLALECSRADRQNSVSHAVGTAANSSAGGSGRAGPSTDGADSAGTSSSSGVGGVGITRSNEAIPSQHCKALGKKGVSVLATTSEPEPRLAVEGDSLYLFGYTHELARSALYRVSRAGGKLETVAVNKGVGEHQGLAFGGGAAYYAQRGSVFKLGPGVGAAIELHQGAHSSLALAGDRLFVVECDAKGPDKLLELPTVGGEPTLLAELSHTSSQRCNYPSIVADATEVLIADWRTSRVVAVSRGDKSVRELVTKKGFPSSLNLDGESLALLGALGLLRVPRVGGDVKKLLDAEKFAAPFSSLQVHGGEYWLLDQLAYATTTTLFRMPRTASAPKAVVSYHVHDPVGPSEKGDSGIRAFTIDDECIYAVEWRFGQNGSQLTARARQGPTL